MPAEKEKFLDDV